MAKFAGVLGVVTEPTEQIEDGIPTGVYKSSIEHFSVSGDILNFRQTNTQKDSINDDILLNNRFSILASPSIVSLFAGSVKTSAYLEVWGTKWKISGFEVRQPRIIFDIGGIWNEEKNGPSQETP